MKTAKEITISTKQEVSFDLLGQFVTVRTADSSDPKGVVTSVTEPCAYNEYKYATLELDHKIVINIY